MPAYDTENSKGGWDASTEFVAFAMAQDLAAAGVSAEMAHMRALPDAPQVRERLHSICALYAHASGNAQRRALLDRLETMTLELAHLMAFNLLEAGWRPGP